MTDHPLPAPLTDAEWPAGLERLRDGFAGRLNVYRVMAHHPPLLVAWERLRNHVVLDSALAPDLREIVILRVGHRWGSHYEWAQHVVRGREAGLSDARIIACRADAPGGADAVLLATVDALLARGRLTPDDVATAQAMIGRAALFDVMATIGMYSTLAFLLNSFATALEPEIEARLDTRPLAP